MGPGVEAAGQLLDPAVGVLGVTGLTVSTFTGAILPLVRLLSPNLSICTLGPETLSVLKIEHFG